MGKFVDYENDFYTWALHNAALLRQGRWAEIDSMHIAEELESIGKRDRRELVSRLKILFAHLLKWQYQPIYRCSSWQGSIVEQRSQLNDLIKANPGLKPYLSEAVTLAYPDAVELACEETGLLATTFPKVYPYPPEQALAKGFYPES